MWIFAIFAALAAIASATGARQSAKAQEQAANYNTQLNKQNAETTAQQASFDADLIREKNKRILGAQRAAYSASGIDPDSATAMDVQDDSATQGELDALVAIYTGRTSSTSYMDRARLSSMEARNAKTAGKIGVTTSLLGGASSIGLMYAKSNPSF